MKYFKTLFSNLDVEEDLNLTASKSQGCVGNEVSDKDLNSPIGSEDCASVGVEGQDTTSVKGKTKTWADVVKLSTVKSVQKLWSVELYCGEPLEME